VTYELHLELQRQREVDDFKRKQKGGKSKDEVFNPDAEDEIRYNIRNMKKYLIEKFEVIYDGSMG